MKQLDGDHDQRLLGPLAEINGAPLATTAHGIDGGEVERMARNARSHGRQAGSRRPVAALVDDRVKANIRDERPSIGEACERAEFADQGGGRLRADARDGLQQLGVGGPSSPRPPALLSSVFRGEARAWLTSGAKPGCSPHSSPDALTSRGTGP